MRLAEGPLWPRLKDCAHLPDEMMTTGTKKHVAGVTEAFLQMKKFDIAELQRVYEESQEVTDDKAAQLSQLRR